MTVKEANKQVKSKTLFGVKYDLSEILPNDFVSTNTKFKTANEMFLDVDFSSQEEFDNLDISILDALVARNSNFQSWVQFLQKAADFHQSLL